jgi:pterin-4a-carbinolamine dehydratase
MPLAFISYRRQDSSAAARWIARAISETFGTDSVFIDTEAIRVGDNWPARIDQALEQADVLIMVIGHSWLRIPDKYGKRRLDYENDWVRNEIAHALQRGIPIFPILISGAKRPPKEGLVEGIEGLLNLQELTLDDTSWDRDLNELLTQLGKLENCRFDRVGNAVRLWPQPALTLRDLNHEEIAAARAKLLDWRVVRSSSPGPEPPIELRRIFEFKSFEDAMCFINDAAEYASRVDHHPRWENVWRTVTVWLSTWDIGHKPSKLDVDMAEHFDQLFTKYS